MKDITFIDIETTGLSPAAHEITEIAAVRVRGDLIDYDPHDGFDLPAILRADGVRGSVYELIKIDHPDRADPAAFRLQRPPTNVGRISIVEAIRKVRPFLDGAIPAGHNVRFDLDFLGVAWARHGFAPSWGSHHVYDTMAWVQPLKIAGAFKSVALASIMREFDAPFRSDMPHNALEDAVASLFVALHMVHAVREGLDDADDNVLELFPHETTTKPNLAN